MMQNLLNRCTLFIALALVSIPVFSQSVSDDINLIKRHGQLNFEQATSHEHRHRPEFLLQDHPSALVRYNPITLSFGSLMWIYQLVLTDQLSSTCIYSPTCSAYSKSLIQDYGLAVGIILTSDRLTRCNRLALYDYSISEIDKEIHRIHQDTDYYRLRK